MMVGQGKDGIPSIDEPEFLPVDQVDYLNENDLVLGLKQGDKIKAYPHAILNWHEIVNDKAGKRSVAVTYCPLTGTGIAWNRLHRLAVFWFLQPQVKQYARHNTYGQILLQINGQKHRISE
jgi:hypothetical protein